MLTPNDRQRQAAEVDADHCVTIAGPGTGKSKVLFWRAEHLVKSGSCAASDIALVSFTNASVADLRETLAAGEFPSAEGIRLTTFHSLALRSLLRMGSTNSTIFIADDWEEACLLDPYLKRTLGLPTVVQARSRRGDYDARWCQATENPEEWLDAADRRNFQRAFMAAKQTLDFTTRGELTYRWWLKLSGEPAASNADLGIDFEHILVDEYQDLNECEHSILEILGQREVGVFVAGDPNQSIYEGMRHAHPELCLSFADRFTSAENVVLNETYRCSPAVLEAAAALMNGQPGAAEVPTISHRPAGGCVVPVNYTDEKAEASGVSVAASNYARHQSDARILIVAPNRKVGGLVSGLLTQLDVEHQVSLRSTPILEPDTARLARSFVRLLGNAGDSLAAATAIILSGTKKHRIDNLNGLVKACEEGQKNTSALLADTPHELPDQLAKAVATARTKLAELKALSTQEAIGSLESESGLEGLEAYLQPAHQRRAVEELADSGESEEKIDDDMEEGEEVSAGITVTTYHSSKGLEADIVFAMAVEPAFFEADARSAPAEMRRLLFVGMTRARDGLYTSYASRRYGPSHYISTGQGSHRRGPSAFLAGVTEHLDLDTLSGTQFVSRMTERGCCQG